MNNSSPTPAGSKPSSPLPFSYLELRTKVLNLSLVVAAALGLLVILNLWGHPTPIVFGAIIAAVVVLLAAAIVPLPYSVRAGILLAVLFGFAINEILQTGIFGTAGIFFLAFTLLAGVLFDRREFLIALGLSVAATAIVGWLMIAGIVTLAGQAVTSERLAPWIVGILLMVLVSFGLGEAWRRLKQEYFVTQATLKNAMSTLSNERVNLETRIVERTKETAAIAESQKKRADLFHDIHELMQTTASIQEPDELMSSIAQRIGEKFHLYHVGIYLNDENTSFTNLRAAYGAGSERLLARGYRLKIDHSGIVNYVAASGLPRIVKRVKDDILYDNNPDLPETRAMMALPLLRGQQIVGVLDLESNVEGGISDQDLEAMTVLANQIATSIDNSLILSETRRSLAEARVVYGHYMRQAWEQIAAEKRTVGYRYAASKANPLETPLDLPEIQSALQSGQPVTSTEEKSTITIPLKLRDEVIGVLDIRSNNPNRQWNENEMALIQAIAERVSLALENARLFEETTRRADRERTVSEISTHIRSTTDPQVMLKTALEELKRALGAKDIRIHPYSPPSAEQASK